MAIKVTCPGCEASLSLAEELRGKKVRCKKCETSLRVPDDDESPDDGAIQDNVKLKSKAAAPDDETVVDDADAPVKKKKKKKKQSGAGMMPIIIVAGVLIGVFVLAGGGIGAYFLLRTEPVPAPKNQEQAKANEKKDNEPDDNRQPHRIIVPKIGEGNPAANKKGGLGVVQNVRGAVYRAERRSELQGMHRFFTAYELETPRGQRTLDSYLAYIKRDYGPVHDAIKEGYYKVNVKVQPGSNEILAGERDIDAPGHFIVRANGTIEHVPEAEFKKAFNIP